MGKFAHWSLDQFAKHYAETLATPPNAWGQHVSPLFGQSHEVMRIAREYYSAESVDRAFSKAIREKGI